jgi:hypothetical protein
LKVPVWQAPGLKGAAMSPFKRFLGARFFPAILIVLGLLALYPGVNDMLTGWQSKGWPSVEGTVRSAKIAISTSGTTNNVRGQSATQTHFADIVYDYATDGTAHEGYRVSFGETGDVDIRVAEDILSQYPEGSTVRVFYNPDSPRESVLEPGLHGYPWLFLVPAPIFVGLGLFMARFFPKASSRQVRYPILLRRL